MWTQGRGEGEGGGGGSTRVRRQEAGDKRCNKEREVCGGGWAGHQKVAAYMVTAQLGHVSEGRERVFYKVAVNDRRAQSKRVP